jgi:hypothetical protein
VVLWGIAGLALLVALAGYASARRVSRKLDALSQSYWELRYDYTRLRAQVARLDPDTAADQAESAGAAPAAPAAPAASVTFVPLSAMRKKDK